MDYVIIISVLFFCCWIVCQIQKRIGEEQARDWIKFVKDNPHLFKHPSKSPGLNPGSLAAEEQKKST